MSVEDFNNGLIMGLSLQGTMFVDRGEGGGDGGLISQPKYNSLGSLEKMDKLKPMSYLSKVDYSYYIE